MFKNQMPNPDKTLFQAWAETLLAHTVIVSKTPLGNLMIQKWVSVNGMPLQASPLKAKQNANSNDGRPIL